MPSNSDRGSSNDVFGKVEAKLARVRSAATAPPDKLESWLKRTFNPAAPSSRQGDLNGAVLEALEAAVAALRETGASQHGRLEQLERNLTEMGSLSTAAEAQLAQMRQEQGELRERSAAAGTQLTQLVEKIGQLAAGQGDLDSELRERIQQLLDEQRVCLRQLALKTSEEAVLAERARRATELRLEEFARRLPESPT